MARRLRRPGQRVGFPRSVLIGCLLVLAVVPLSTYVEPGTLASSAWSAVAGGKAASLHPVDTSGGTSLYLWDETDPSDYACEAGPSGYQACPQGSWQPGDEIEAQIYDADGQSCSIDWGQGSGPQACLSADNVEVYSAAGCYTVTATVGSLSSSSLTIYLGVSGSCPLAIGGASTFLAGAAVGLGTLAGLAAVAVPSLQTLQAMSGGGSGGFDSAAGTPPVPVGALRQSIPPPPSDPNTVEIGAEDFALPVLFDSQPGAWGVLSNPDWQIAWPDPSKPPHLAKNPAAVFERVFDVGLGRHTWMLPADPTSIPPRPHLKINA